MELNILFQYIQVIWREVWQRKFKVALLVTLMSFAFLTLGALTPSSFQSSVTIYADNQNIIKPLLGKTASVTGVKQNRATQVQDIIYSPRMLGKVIDETYGKEAFADSTLRDQKIIQLREKITLEGLSGNYIKIAFEDDSADRTFRILNNLVSLFIEDSANTKREESRGAYQFIEQQVESYKEQLLRSEEKLKSFQANNLDGTAEEVNARIASLRATIEEMKIQVQESDTKIASLQKQLDGADKFATKDYEAAIYHAQLKQLEQQRNDLLMHYKEDYPGVLDLNYQIENLQKTIAALNDKPTVKPEAGAEFNPIYTQLRSKLGDAEVESRTLKNRLASFQQLADEAFARRKRIAANQAELSELTRDYSVMKSQYEEMLSKKEKARLSMVLDIEGQGVNYKIQEPATYPTMPSGIRFLHFVIFSPLVSMLLVLAFFSSKIILDGRIRMASQLSHIADVQVIGCLEHTLTRSEKKQARLHNLLLILFTLMALTLYVGLALTHKYNVPLDQLFHLDTINNAIK